MNRAEQLDLWLEGESVHTSDRACCPDYSCCHPHRKWSDEQRRKYYYASEAVREKMEYEALVGTPDAPELLDFTDENLPEGFEP